MADTWGFIIPNVDIFNEFHLEIEQESKILTTSTILYQCETCDTQSFLQIWLKHLKSCQTKGTKVLQRNFQWNANMSSNGKQGLPNQAY